MENWLRDSLSNLLNFPVPDDMINFVMSIDNSKELQSHMKTLLDFENVSHRAFFDELVKKRFGPGKKKVSKNKENLITDNLNDEQQSEDADSGNNKKKTKFINLYSKEGQNAQVVFLKGRHHCDCQASKHGLINNCTNCGRVVCKQEGSGPCLFCGQLVCTPEELKHMNSKTKAGVKLMKSLMEEQRPQGWEAALAHRNRLLDYDRTSERRTRVTDDDSDYFSSNSVWLSADERRKLRQYEESVLEKKHASRLDRKVTFDFAGRRIVEEHDTAAVDVDRITAIHDGVAQERVARETHDLYAGGGDRDVAPGVNAELLAFDPSADTWRPTSPPPRLPPAGRLQDAATQQMVDAGRCLSMHQPWASLLVDGIKLHEGRTWYTSHRGRLWIASTAKPPDQETIRALENTYRTLHPDKTFTFPTFYPTGCLLGCVNVDDVLSQEEYRKLYPDGESDSPYVLVCSDPVSLRVRFPVKGQHKIYNLDKVIHKAAVKFMMKSAKESAETQT